MAAPRGTFQRPDLGLSFEELDLMGQQKGMVAQRVLPVIDVALQTANFSVVKLSSLLSTRNTARASGAGYNRQDWEFEQMQYATEEHGAEEVLDDRERNIYAYTIDFERISTMRAYDVILRNREVRVANALFNATTFTPNPVTTEWSNFSSSTPIDDVLNAITAFKAQCGMLPNAIVFNDKVLRNLSRNAQIIDQLKYAGVDDPKQLATPGSLAALATLFQLEEVIVPNVVKNTTPGAATATLADIWDDEYAMLLRVPRTRDLREPCLGRTFHWTGDGSSENGTVEMYRDERVRSDVVRVRHDVDEKIIYTSCGYLLSNITA